MREFLGGIFSFLIIITHQWEQMKCQSFWNFGMFSIKKKNLGKVDGSRTQIFYLTRWTPGACVQLIYVSFPLVANLHGVYTAGSGLESTCLVFAYGLDLYWTRITPSRMFDVLKEDFDFWFIFGTLGILVLVTIVSQRLASIKMLRQAWQWGKNWSGFSVVLWATISYSVTDCNKYYFFI